MRIADHVRRTRHGAAGRGFTLIELLVVISLIGLLVSILVPSIGRAKQLATLVVCETRARGIGQASQFYANDNDNYVLRDYNYVAGSDHYLWASRYGEYMGYEISPDLDQQDDLLYDELREIDLLRCPAVTDERHVLHYVVNAVDFDLYAQNGTWSPTGPTRLSDLPAEPELIWYIAEANVDVLPTHQFDLHDCWQASHVPFDLGVEQPDPRVLSPRSPRHLTRASVVYFDGHAGALPIDADHFGVDLFNPLRVP